MRKDSDFEVMDHIKVSCEGNDKIARLSLIMKALSKTKLLQMKLIQILPTVTQKNGTSTVKR